MSNNSFGEMPEDSAEKRLLRTRQRRAQIWYVVFQLALVTAILALSALLFNLINDSFGYVAVENKIDPDQLMVVLNEQKMLSATGVISGENDTELAAGVAANPYAVGLVGYAYFVENESGLRTVSVNGVAPSEQSVEAGEYDLTRPLYLYTTDKILKSKPQVGAFIDYYLANVNSQIDDVGYFSLPQQLLDEQAQSLATYGATAGEPTATEGDILVGGSSTVYPLTVRMAEGFQAAGFPGGIDVQSSGTKQGFADLCNKRGSVVDLANASRQIQRQEAELCKKNKASVVPFEVGLDGIAVIVSAENTFLTNATTAELQQIFLGATYWSEVNPDWPNEPIARYLPSPASGTLDYFTNAVFDQQLHELPAEDLIAILQYSLSAGAVNALDKEKPLAQRTQEELHALVLQRVVQPKIVASWNLVESIFQRDQIEATVADKYPEAELEFYAWLNRSLLTNTQSSNPAEAGIRTALLGTLWVVLICFLFAVPVGVGAAVYLEEYTGRSRLNHIIQTNIDNLAGVPSIIYGILGLAVLVRFFVQITSGAAFGLTDPATASGRTVLAAGITLGLLILPVIIIASQEAIRAVPQSLREAAYGMGATKWQVIWHHVLPVAIPGILTGTILALSRAAGETAPLIVVGASTFITTDPTGPFAKFTVVPMQIYQWTARPQAEFKHLAAAASIVLMILVFLLNGAAIYMRNRFSKRF